MSFTKTYFIQTFGCAMNEYDSERIASAVESRGYIPCEAPSQADLIIYNTCSVREKPQIKIASYLGRVRIYKEKNPNIIVGISGCVAQQEGEALLKRFKIVNFIMGTDAVSRIGTILDRAISGERFTDTTVDESGSFSIDGFNRQKSVSASVTIMKGCENFCSYCIVPFVRGKEQSRRPQEIIDEIKRLIDKGIKEVTLLGQNVNSYGCDFNNGIDFSELLKMTNKLEGINRIRFITSHPKDFSEKMINTIAECEKVCKYIHLPLQSGSDRVLELMNRKYTYKDYMDKIDYARKVMPEIGFSSDFITGFPGETEEDFSDTLKAIKYVGYDHIFAFNYSPRPGTAAAQIGDTIPYDIKNNRLNRILNAHNEILDSKLSKYVGTVTEVLVTGRSKNDNKVFTGCNTLNRNVNFEAVEDIEVGRLVKIEITNAKRHSLFGRLI